MSSVLSLRSGLGSDHSATSHPPTGVRQKNQSVAGSLYFFGLESVCDTRHWFPIMTPPLLDRPSLLRDLAAITTMQRGTLAEEYREHPSPDGKGTVRLGPYFKHQCWENGRNLSRRVPAREVPALREDLANASRFAEITARLAEITVAETRALRAAQAEAALASDPQSLAAKKNSRKNARPKNSAKPSASSPKRRAASPPKA